MSDEDDKDGTRVGGGPPARPKLPAAPTPAASTADAGADTHHGAAPPKPPQTGPQSSAPAGAEDDGGETLLIDTRPQRAAQSLQRVQPPGHTEMVYLSGASYRLGRAEGCDIVLYSPTASRHHADLSREPQGWLLTPAAGKAVLAEGSLVQEAVCLRNQMRLQLGGDEFIFHDDAAASEPTPVATATPHGAASRRWLWLVAALAAALALGLWLVLRGLPPLAH